MLYVLNLAVQLAGQPVDPIIVIAAIGQIATAGATLVVGLGARRKVDEIHVLVNGRYSEQAKLVSELRERIATDNPLDDEAQVLAKHPENDA
jgi:hypothetical protein